MTERKILGSVEAAKMLGTTIGNLAVMRYKKLVPYYKSAGGHRVYYLQNELEDWMLATRVATASEVEEQATKELL